MKVNCYRRRESNMTTVFAGNRIVLTDDIEHYLAIHVGENLAKKLSARMIIDKNDRVEVLKGMVTSNIVVCIWHDQKHFFFDEAIDHVKKD